MNNDVYLLSTASFLPEKILSNSDLEKIVDTNDEWITTRTGIKERRICSGQVQTSDMGVAAAKIALERAKLSINDIDLILTATCTPDTPCPATAALIQKKLGAKDIPAMDVNAACTGFLYALSLAKAYVASGMYETLLVVASEKLSPIIDYQDRSTCILFGDGAGACIVSKHPGPLQLGAISLGADGNQDKLLGVKAGGSQYPASYETVDKRWHYMRMEGREVFKHAVLRMGTCLKSLCQQEGLSESDIHHLIPHQANTRILDALAERFHIPCEKVFKTVHKYGNTSASSVIIALDEFFQTNKAKEGENILLVAFGAGFTWGACHLKNM